MIILHTECAEMLKKPVSGGAAWWEVSSETRISHDAGADYLA